MTFSSVLVSMERSSYIKSAGFWHLRCMQWRSRRRSACFMIDSGAVACDDRFIDRPLQRDQEICQKNGAMILQIAWPSMACEKGFWFDEAADEWWTHRNCDLYILFWYCKMRVLFNLLEIVCVASVPTPCNLKNGQLMDRAEINKERNSSMSLLNPLFDGAVISCFLSWF